MHISDFEPLSTMAVPSKVISLPENICPNISYVGYTEEELWKCHVLYKINEVKFEEKELQAQMFDLLNSETRKFMWVYYWEWSLHPDGCCRFPQEYARNSKSCIGKIHAAASN